MLTLPYYSSGSPPKGGEGGRGEAGPGGARVSGAVLWVVLLLAYGPLVLVVGIWVAAAILAALGRPALRDWLLRRTAQPQPDPPADQP